MLYLTFRKKDYETNIKMFLYNLRTYVKLMKLSKGYQQVLLSKKIIDVHYMYFELAINIEDIDGKIGAIYDILIEDALKFHYVPMIKLVYLEKTITFDDVPKDDYKKEDTKNLFLKKSNSHCKILRRSN